MKVLFVYETSHVKVWSMKRYSKFKIIVSVVDCKKLILMVLR